MTRKIQAMAAAVAVFMLMVVGGAFASETDSGIGQLNADECAIQKAVTNPATFAMVCPSEPVDDAEYGVVYVQAPHMPIAD